MNLKIKLGNNSRRNGSAKKTHTIADNCNYIPWMHIKQSLYIVINDGMKHVIKLLERKLMEVSQEIQ